MQIVNKEKLNKLRKEQVVREAEVAKARRRGKSTCTYNFDLIRCSINGMILLVFSATIIDMLNILKTIIVSIFLCFLIVSIDLKVIETELVLCHFIFIAAIALIFSLFIVLDDLDAALALFVHSSAVIATICIFLMFYRMLNDKFIIPSFEELQSIRELYIKKQRPK